MSNEYIFKEYPRTCAADDFWGQVKRTVNGRPVGEDQIAMIVTAVTDGLELGHDDVLIDLCCGNGALSTRLFAQCQGGVGVDYSESLIEVAEKNFQQLPRETYVLGDVIRYLEECANAGSFTKALCYGALQYLPSEQVSQFLETLHRRFSAVQRLYIGSLPDKDRMGEFFRDSTYRPGIEDDPDSSIGIWRTQQEFTGLSAGCGWLAECRQMPKEFFASGYRYDAILSRE